MSRAERADGVSRLESRCRRLLIAYPQPYRTDRGGEIIATLLDAAPDGRNWPPARDAWSLISGGRRARAIRNRRLPLITNLRLAALLAAALWLSNAVPDYLEFALHPGIFYRLPALSQALFVVCALGACLAIASAWLWPRRVTVGLALAVSAAAALACSQTLFLGGAISDVRLIGPPLLLAALAAGKDRPPRCWLWMPCAFLIAPIPALVLSPAGGWWPIPASLFVIVFFGTLGVILLWLAVDARPAIAFGMYFEVFYVLRSVSMAPRLSDVLTFAPNLIIPLLAAALAGLALRVRRSART